MAFAVLAYLGYVLAEVAIFIVIDGFTKQALRSARTEADKNQTWFVEGLVMLAMVTILYLSCGHFPLFLFTLAAVTMMFSLFRGNGKGAASPPAFWQNLRSTWNDCQEFSDYMEDFKQTSFERRPEERVPMVSAAPMNMSNSPSPQLKSLRYNEAKGIYEYVPQGRHRYSAQQKSNTAQPSSGQKQQQNFNISPPYNVRPWAQANQPVKMMGPQLTMSTPAVGGFNRRPIRGFYGNGPVQTASAPVTLQQARPNLGSPAEDDFQVINVVPVGDRSGEPKTQSQTPQNVFGSAAKIPMGVGDGASSPHSHMESSPKPQLPTMVASAATSTARLPGALARSIGGVFGLKQKVNLPPALHAPVNMGSGGMGNSCFVNSVIQCLTRAPGLADGLSEEAKGVWREDDDDMHEQQDAVSLLDTCAELMQQLNVLPAENDVVCLNSSALMEIGSALSPNLFSPPGVKQHQQDVAEFLNWLITQLHEVINDAQESGLKSTTHQESFKSLKIIYGDFSVKHRQKLQEVCKSEIASSESLYSQECAEHVQLLSDLDWLRHKESNASIVDRLFMGQMMECIRCVGCNHTVLNFQVFNILSVPVPQPYPREKPLTLGECIQDQYGASETPMDMVPCSYCAPATESCSIQQKGKSTRDPGSSMVTPPVSPINPKLNLLNQHRTSSTPVGGALNPRQDVAPKVPLSMRTTSTLLRKMPECVTIQLLRFKYNQEINDALKIKTGIDIPLTCLDLSTAVYDSIAQRDDQTEDNGHFMYNLYGLCLHYGESISWGHYACYIKAVDGQWYFCNDDKVEKVYDIETVLKSEDVRSSSYLLFYHKQHTEAESAKQLSTGQQ